jgi:hypothetical protein
MSTIDDHNKGQADAANGKYDPPIGIMEDLCTWTSKGCQEITERNGAYRAGWNHAKGQE